MAIRFEDDKRDGAKALTPPTVAKATIPPEAPETETLQPRVGKTPGSEKKRRAR